MSPQQAISALHAFMARVQLTGAEVATFIATVEACERALRAEAAVSAPEPEPSASPEPQEQGEGAPDAAPAEGEQQKGEPSLAALGQAFASHFISGAGFASIAQARQFAARLLGRPVEPGTPEAKLVDEAVELGVVMAARQIVEKHRPISRRTVYGQLVRLYERQPRLGTRTSDSIERQAYSTPAPLAWIASELAGITRRSHVLEPTAGTGMLLIGADPQRAVANELDPTRRQALEAQGFETSGADASRPGTFESRAVDAVIANPPFGAVRGEGGQTVRFDLSDLQDGYRTGEIDHAIALRALEGMKDDGRAVLILGGIAKTVTDPAQRADAYHRSKAKREFFYLLYNRYRVVDHFTVAGELYAKQGAAWPVDVIVIAGRGKSALPLPAQRAPRIYASWDDLAGLLERTNDDRGLAAADRPADGVDAAGGEPGPGRGGDQRGRPADGAAPDRLPGGAVGAGGVDGGAVAGSGGSRAPAAAEPAGAGSVEPRAPRGRAGQPGAAAAGGQPGVAGLPESGDRLPRGAADAGEGRPSGGARGADDDAAGVDEPRVPADGRSDLDALFDEVLDEEFGAAPVAQAVGQPNPKSAPDRQPADARSTPQVAASAARNTARGIADIAASLESILLPKGGKISSNPLFDPEQYGRVLPLLKEAVRHFREAWGDVKELMRRAVRALTEAIPEERRRAFAEALRPYITRFAQEVQSGAVQLEEAQAEPQPAPAPEAPKAPRKPRQQDEETDRQVAYQPRADADGVGTLVPINMQTAVSRALAAAEQRAGKPLVEFVSERLGYTPDEVRRYFSAEQIDALALAIFNLDDGAGFVIGDQTGVGKGRFVAAMIRYALSQGLIPVFVTEKPNLYRDMARDLTDIGMPDVLDQILPTNAALNLPLTDDEQDGPRLKTPEAKDQNARLSALSADQMRADRRIVFTTYSQMQQIGGADTARINFLRRIAPSAFIILDESHNAGGAQKGEIGEKIAEKAGTQDRGAIFRKFLREARAAVYSSATWAKRPDVMDLYGIKTDMRLAVDSLSGLAEAIQRGGVPMQQIVSAMLAQSGQYIRRERSFAGVSYDLERIEVDRDTYDGVASALARIYEISTIVGKVAKEKDKEAKAEAKRLSPDGSTGGAGVESANFGAVMHNLINQMLLASKAPGTVRLALDALRRGEKPVIAVANTMGSFIEEYAKEMEAAPGDRLNLTFNTLLERYLRRTLRLTEKRPFMKKGEKAKEIWLTPAQLGPEGEAKYRAAERLIQSLRLDQFPLSPIDYIRSGLEREGYKVGEITGRTEAADYRADGGVYYRRRPQKETTAAGRLDAIRRFNGGSKDKPLPPSERLDVMILNQSGATGLSLHANAAFGDQRKRVMLIAQAEANIDTHMQMLGRVHRTGQVVAPAYLQLVADVPAEKRPAAVLAKKMASLAAATTANRRGALAAEDSPDFLNEYGDEVVAEIVGQDVALWKALGEPQLKDENDDPTDAARRVTGRIPLLPLEKQEELYAKIEKAYRRAIEIADEQGTNTLEAKTLDLDAKLIEEKPWTDGKGDRLFAGPSKIGLYDVKKQSRPPALYTVATRIAEAVGYKPSENWKDAPREKLAEVIEALAVQQAEDWREMAVTGVESAHRDMRALIDGRDMKGKALEKAIQRADDQRARILAILRNAKPGGFVEVEVDGGAPQQGLVLSISQPESGNHLAPSNWEMTVLMPDGSRVISSFAGLFTPDNRPQSGDDATRSNLIVIREVQPDWESAYGDFLAQLQSAAREQRERRWIVTGNLLAGFAKRRGQIANFYTADGQLLQGIIMPADFDLEKFEAGELPVFARASQAAAFLQDRAVSMPMIQTRDGKVRVARTDRGEFIITTPASKAEGADWYLDRHLRADVGDFVSARGGAEMRATVSPTLLARVMDRLAQIAAGKRQDLVSKNPEAKDWLANSKGEAPRSGGMPLYSTPFDPALWDRMVWQPLREWLGGSTALTRVAQAVREENIRVVRRLWAGVPVPDGVEVKERVENRDLGPIARMFKTPRWAFKRFPELARLVELGIVAEENQSVWVNRLTEEYERIRKTLSQAKGDWERVQGAIWAADAAEVDLEDAATARDFWEEQGLSPAEARAATALNRLLVKQARLVDQHRRAMLPKVKAQKALIWSRMQEVLNSKSVPTESYAKAYRRRAYLTRRIREGKGGLAAHAAEIERLNQQLREERLKDDGLQALMTKLQDEYDALEARLNSTSVRRRKGYAPHKFYGSWRLFEELEPDEEGNPQRKEITSDQGFYDSRGEAIAAAAEYLRQNPGAKLTVEPRVVTFPNLGGAVLTDAAYGRLKRQLEEAAAEEGITSTSVGDLLNGIARPRSRRRVFAPGLFRKGAKGFSEDLDKVMRTHIGQTVRYVTMDRLKFAYVSTTERIGLSPYRLASVKLEGRENLLAAVEAWWRDVNGAKQGHEAILDGMLQRLGVPGSVLAAMGVGFAGPGVLMGAPVTGAVLSGYLGWRMYRAHTKGGEFPFRSLVQGITSDMAHLKLGMAVNIGSALVNLSQTFINTLPIMGPKWTAIGAQRAAAALFSQAVNANSPGRMSNDAHLLARADIRTRFRFAEDSGFLDRKASQVRRISMWAFEGAERLNRATAFLAAHARAEAEGKSPAQAFAAGQEAMRRTQFHGGNANRPEIVRVQALKLPLQFKNFLLQQIAFFFGLRPGQVATFLLMMTLLGGLLAFPGFQFLDWLTDGLLGFRPSDAVAEWIADAQMMGDLAGGAVHVLARGLPALLGADISRRIGMGAGFLPEQGSDMQGPAISTVAQVAALEREFGRKAPDVLTYLDRQRMHLVDLMLAASPAAMPLKVLEAAANGASIGSPAFTLDALTDDRAVWTNPRKRGNEEIEPTTGELAMRAAGLQPVRWTERGALERSQLDRVAERRKDEGAYLAEIIQAVRDGREERIPQIRQEAAQAGVRLTPQRIREARQSAEMDRAARAVRQAPRQDRGELRRRIQAIDERTGAR